MVNLNSDFQDDFNQYYGTSFDMTAGQERRQTSLEKLQDPKFINTLKDYYSYRDGNDFQYQDDADVLEYFYNDRTWRNYNTGSISRDLANVLGENDPKRLEQFSEINTTYQNLPNFWDDPNRDFGQWLWDFGGAMLLDPANLIGIGVGKMAARDAYKVALKKALQGKMAKHVNAQVIKKAQLQANKAAFASAVKRGALYEGVFSGLVTGTADTMLQHTAIQSGVQDNFSFKRLGLNTAFGFGMGTVFGGAFTAGAFKYSLSGQGKNSLKNLEDIHNYGFDELRGGRLFYDLTQTKKGKGAFSDGKALYKNKTQDEIDAIKDMVNIRARTTDEHIKNIRKTMTDPFNLGKPPKQLFNFERWAQGDDDEAPVRALKALSIENQKWIKERVKKNDFQSIREAAEVAGLDPVALEARVKEFGADSTIAADLLAMRILIKKVSSDLVKYGAEIDTPSITKADRDKYISAFLADRNYIIRLLKIQKQAQETLATALASQRQEADISKAARLLVNPEDTELGRKLEGDVAEYMKAISKLDDDNHIILSLQQAQSVNKWDLASEYVNNALLSSPDTHLINLVSGFVNMQVRPFEMMIRSGFLLRKDRERAKIVAKEAIQTYIYQYVYTADAIKAAYRTFKAGRPILDSTALKYDSHIRQGQLMAWLQNNVRLFTGDTGLGKLVKGAADIPIIAQTLPLRVLSAGDELMKTMAFKARAAAMIDTAIRRDHPEVMAMKGSEGRDAYRKLMQKYMDEFFVDGKAAKSTRLDVDNSVRGKFLSKEDRLEVNDPLQYAREVTYTQPASSQAQRADGTFEGAVESRVTGWVLRTTANNRWLRALGLHFINTPSNLIRFNLQRFPVLGKIQFQMRQMLKKDPETGKFINPEAAAEAHARMTMGGLIWSAAIMAAISGKFTPGGEREWKLNQNKEMMSNWQPYSIRTSDGRYINMNRLDPFVMPFGIAADIVDAYQKWGRNNEFMPPEVEGKFTEIIVATLVSITRNLSSKFYTKGILESANLFMSDGYMHWKDPERIGGSFLARTIYKWIPLSGALRYVNRVNDEHDREMWTFMDRMRALNPTDDPHNVMPRRNILGEPIDRKNGWLFGIGGKEGIWSSPFAMTQFKNTETAKFFEDKEITIRPPSKIDKYTKLNLKTLRDPKTGQSAYDRWMEIKGKMLLDGKTLKETIEELVADKRSELYLAPSKPVYGVDYRQVMISKIITEYTNAAYPQMVKEFPQIEKQYRLMKSMQQEAFDEEEKNYLKGIMDY